MAKKNIKNDIEKILISEDEIEEIVGRISANVDDYYRDRDSRLLLLGILKGSVVFMGERGDPEAHVFPNFSYSSYYLMELKRWAVRAGITKDITFHSGRHTFAVLMLGLGADIYTVQKLLGHKEIHTTQIYANIMDKKKQEAAMLIPQILPTIDIGGEDKKDK